jgi:hypothetical protein
MILVNVFIAILIDAYQETQLRLKSVPLEVLLRAHEPRIDLPYSQDIPMIHPKTMARIKAIPRRIRDFMQGVPQVPDGESEHIA